MQRPQAGPYRTAMGTWSSPRSLARFSFANAVGADVWAPLALTQSGNAAVAWIAGFGNTGAPLQIATYNATTHAWTSPHLRSAEPNGFGIAATGSDAFLSVWSTDRRATLMTATSSDGKNRSTRTRLAQYRHPSDLNDYLTDDQKGDVTLTLSGQHSRIFYLTRPTDGNWTAAESAGTGASPEVTVDDHAVTTLRWDQVHREESQLEVRTIR